MLSFNKKITDSFSHYTHWAKEEEHSTNALFCALQKVYPHHTIERTFTTQEECITCVC